ncbi:hypothetical protein GCM10009096_31970 [Parasphingorhabdus litoris]|uniref:Uncharacterized protein n=1 Tax=Parasphingorhabdus litoris TaxID=394733 RepID=A0ABN1AYY1_9SPHN
MGGGKALYGGDAAFRRFPFIIDRGGLTHALMRAVADRANHDIDMGFGPAADDERPFDGPAFCTGGDKKRSSS